METKGKLRKKGDGRPLGLRLASWKAIAEYAEVSVATVQRWEKSEHLPVHRHMHRKIGSVYAFTREFDDWLLERDTATEEP